MNANSEARCDGCDRVLTLTVPDFDLYLFGKEHASSTGEVDEHEDWVGICIECISFGYSPPPESRRGAANKSGRQKIVVENCEFHIRNDVGLVEASQREGYSTPGNLRTVLRRWGRLDLENALVAIDREHDHRLNGQYAE